MFFAVTTASARVFQRPQRRQIEMIEMCVRQQDQIDVRQIMARSRGSHQPLQAHGDRTHADAAALAQHRIGQDGESIQLQQHGAVAEPRRVQTVIRPALGMGRKRCGSNQAPAVVLNPSYKLRSSGAGESRGACDLHQPGFSLENSALGCVTG